MEQKKGTVLCVDDEPSILRSLQWLLQKEFEVHTAPSGQQGLSLLQEHDFDVVISDQRMPGMTGSEFLREVRKTSPRALRILLTGYSDLQSILRSVNEGEVFRFINKPWNIAELPRIVAEAARIAQTQPAPALVANNSSNTPGEELEAVLVVDDDPTVADLIRQAVGPDREVIHTTNLADAIEILASTKISVIVSDTRVNHVDSTRLLKMLKQKHPHLVSIVFSSDNDAAEIITLINQGQIHRFVPKPAKVSFLKIVIESALEKHAQLLADPRSAIRHAVDHLPPEAEESLLSDVENEARMGSPSGKKAKGEISFLQKVTGSFAHLFNPV